MKYCFVHAPSNSSWQGIILLAPHRDGEQRFRERDIKHACEVLYPNEDFYDLIYDPNPSPEQVSQYLLRREKGFLQRATQERTYEDLHFDEWIKILGHHYPQLAKFAHFVQAGSEVTKFFDGIHIVKGPNS